MDPVEPNEIPDGLSAGRLEGVSIPDLLWALCRSGKTGILAVTAAHRAWLYVDRGRVLFAASDDPDRRIGALLLRKGAIQLSDLRAAVERQRSGAAGAQRLGMLLVESGCLDEDRLIVALRAQFHEIVADLFALQVGEYRFTEGPLPTDETVTLKETAESLILEGILGVRSFARIRQAVGPPSALYTLTEGWREQVAGLSLSDGREQILERLERGDESVEYLCGEVLLSHFEIHQIVWALNVLGVVERVPPGSEAGEDDAFRSPEPSEGFVDFLLRLCRAGETGVLYASRHAVERSFHLREGRCIFATSSDPDDGLVTHLLRRGAISLGDREETARRLLSNKRVGTILLELGVLDEQELREAIGQQLGEIVWSTVRWDTGDYVFIGGPLPSIEEITLDLDVEALIAEGIRRVTSWSRVRSGSGGLQSRLALLPTYLEVLDAMQAGVEEWDIAVALREPRTPLEICEQLGLGDFRVCQVLWCLRVLGAVRVVDAAEETLDELPVVRTFEPRPIRVPLEDLDRVTEIPVETVLPVERTSPAGLPVLMAQFPQSAMTDVVVDTTETLADASVSEGTPVPEADPAGETPSSVAIEVFDDEPQGTDGIHLDAPVEDTASAADEPGPDAASIWEMERSTRTLRMSREEVESALSGPPEGPDPETPSDGAADAADQAADDTFSAAIPVEEADEIDPVDEADEQDADPVESVPDWEPPSNLDESIVRFNAAQRLVYRTVRVEVGAGAANFIRACCSSDGAESPIGDAELRADGSWDDDGLRQAAIASRLEQPWQAYQRLIDVELDRLQEVIGARQTETLMRKIDQLSADGRT